nr:ATP-binding cassette domain-containing protein [Marinicella sp. W31]MDC2878209.1 ATP-binding cassette domain-containing protein [Marinicella sp. W31]
MSPAFPTKAAASLLKGVAVHKEYGKVHAVRGIDFAIDANSYVTLLGPSGCGKTSLLRMIGGFEEISSGLIELDGRSLTGMGAAKGRSTRCFRIMRCFRI